MVPLVERDGDLAKGAAMVDRVAALQIWCPVFASQWWPVLSLGFITGQNGCGIDGW